MPRAKNTWSGVQWGKAIVQGPPAPWTQLGDGRLGYKLPALTTKVCAHLYLFST